MPALRVKTEEHTELVDMTSQINAIMPSGMDSGICTVFSMHTTAGLTINENADADVKRDIIFLLDKIAPWANSMYRHCEGNTAAHVKASLMGFSLTIPVSKGRLVLGTWQSVYFCEFDGPRDREVRVEFIKGSS
ncbi:MAG: secondary thiamine-phosphate synthase enzyme YjbQ [Victivallales bacterium]